MLVLLVLVALSVYLASAETNPSIKLAEAIKLIEQGKRLDTTDYQELASLLSEIREDSDLKWWAALYRAKLELKGMEPKSAFSLLESIPDSTPAFTEAQLILLSEDREAETTASKLSELIELSDLTGQKTIAAKARLLLAEVLDRRESFKLARVNLRPLLSRSTPVALREQALSALRKVDVHSERTELEQRSIAELKADAALLVSAGFQDYALELLEPVISQLPEGSQLKGQLELEREKALRANSRHQEADLVLHQLSERKQLGVSDQALLRVAKNLWNMNKNEGGLKQLNILREQFPKSTLVGDATYYAGRMLEELGETVQAREEYQDVSEKGPVSVRIRLAAKRRLAWNYFRQGSFSLAARVFGELTNLADDAREHDGAKDLYRHAQFWTAKALRLEGGRETGFQAAQILENLANNSPFSYYGLQAANLLKADSLKSRWGEITKGTEQCELGIPVDFTRKLETLQYAKLNKLAQREIAYRFSATLSTSAKLAHLALNAQFGFPEIAIKQASVLLDDHNVELTPGCRRKLYTVLYPTPFRADFEAAASKENLPLALLYAVTRTESAFNQKAVSRTGARGLMQLMPATASSLGEKDIEALFIPQRNIALGSQLLKQLLDRYKGDKAYALAAYNGGAEAVERWRKRHPDMDSTQWIEHISYPETQHYTKHVLFTEALYEQVLNHPEL